MAGTSRGLDEGLIASTIADKSFIENFGLEADYLSAAQQADRQSNVTTMVTIGCLPGALLAFIWSEKIGMLWAMRQACVLWIVGSIVFLTSHTIGQLYAGRLIMGMGIGQFGVLSPVYLGEVAPRDMRGILIGLFGMSEYLGIMTGYFSIWGASIHISDSSSKQWIIPHSVQIMWAGMLLIFSIFCEESPRYMCKKGRQDKAAETLGKLWDLSAFDPAVQDEITSAQRQLELEYGHSSARSFFGTLKSLFTSKENLKRIAFIFTLQCLIQWSGPTSITTYAPRLFALFGIKGQSQKLFTTAIFGAVKFASSLGSALFMIDLLGRRRTLYIGLTLQLLAFIYCAIFLTIYSTLSETAQEAPAARHAAIGAIVMIYLIGVAWALGWNSIQYIITAEIFPLHVRLAGSSLVTVWHYGNRMGISKAVPTMLLEHGSLAPKGTFWFFSAVSVVGMVYTWMFLPETSKKGLEETGDLYTKGRVYGQESK
ncbi:quinate permease [Aspergillus steynii IBT 23096]|uniref:Quinate permease n=1 Tax=Aspergillus steynii IBT 23096 TaxID=1392250 RepID=A0A2I2GDB8_9EURO|nr:quinate permease [Aspergillus steynii IBT 23096]PLB50885.1 quinate permease [Aspergillus steynii IBT 23096]